MTKLRAADPRFADPRWMAATLATHGQMWIALELGVTRHAVRRQLAVLGIPPMVTGRRRKVSQLALAPAEHPADERYDHDRSRRVVPTKDLLIAQIRALHHAELNGDGLAYDDALLGLSSAAKLTYDHRQKLRAA